MKDQAYQPPRIRSIVFGILLFLVLLYSLLTLSGTMKQVGNVFLYIPSQLGLIQRVLPEQVHTIDLQTPSPAVLDFTSPGRYAIYTSDYDLLMLNLLNGPPWLLVTSQSTREQIPIVSVGRGARPYDTPLAAGRPIFVFDITVPGTYEVAYHFRYASIAIVPDYTTGKEPVILLAIIAQIAILLIIVVIVLYLHNQRHRALTKNIEATLEQRRIERQALWNAEIQKGKKENRENDKM
jgi:hypothetical protein